MHLRQHARHHQRFYVAVAAGLATFGLLRQLAPHLAAMAAGDAFFVVYLGLMAVFGFGAGAEQLRRRADVEDEGAAVILLLTVAAVVFCLGSMFTLMGAKPSTPHLAISLASVPLGWAATHTMLAFHYARLYYARDPVEAASSRGGKARRSDRGGLSFPGDEEPAAWDFLYFSFVLGMTAQTSDVSIEDAGIRRLVLGHSIASFFFNTVLVALAVNLAVSQQ